MHGNIHNELKKYVESKYDAATWDKILAEANLVGKIYWTDHVYPNEEINALVKAASKLTNLSVDQILENFGGFILPHFMMMYKSLLRPEWKTEKMLLNTEEVIHRVVRIRHPGAKPPQLKFSLVEPQKLNFLYDSPLKMSALAKGMINGVAKYYGESVTIDEKTNADGHVNMTILIHSS